MKRILFLFCLLNWVTLFGNEHSLVLFSFPKSGTHFVKELYFQLTNQLIGHDHPHHYPETFSLEILAEKYGNRKIVFLLRDPRDVVISYIDWVDKLSDGERQFWGNRNWDKWSRDKKIVEIIGGWHQPIMKYDVQFVPELERELKGWENAFVARFEDFIGPKGGGCRMKQMAVVKEMATFMVDREFSDEEIEQLVDASFGHSHTFRNPSIGKWKRDFKEFHKELFKSSIWGEMLIELGYEADSNW